MLIKTEDKDLEDLLGTMIEKLGGNPLFFEKFKENKLKNVDMVILDTRETKEEDIKTFIKTLKEKNSSLEIIVLTCKHNIRSSIIAMESGASDELLFPIEVERLEEKIKRILEKIRKTKDIKSIFAKLTDTLSAVTFAEAGEFEIAKEILKSKKKGGKKNE